MVKSVLTSFTIYLNLHYLKIIYISRNITLLNGATEDFYLFDLTFFYINKSFNKTSLGLVWLLKGSAQHANYKLEVPKIQQFKYL